MLVDVCAADPYCLFLTAGRRFIIIYGILDPRVR